MTLSSYGLLYIFSHHFSPLDMFSEDSRAILADSTYIEFDQLPGELLIIPTGWLHQVVLRLIQ